MHVRINRYLEKKCALERWPLVCADRGQVARVVVIPALAEWPGLQWTLDDLARSPADVLSDTLVLCVVNNKAAPLATGQTVRNNQETLEHLHGLVEQPVNGLRVGYIDAASPGHELPSKDGVGLARKLGLDWGLFLLQRNGYPDGPLICLDADTRVEASYLPEIRRFFLRRGRWAAVLDYAHPFEDESPASRAILAYELYLRYHELGLTYAGSPYAFPTIGSTIACTAAAYATVGGMKRRQAGEDFYYLQELAKTGPVERVTETIVRPASRASRRVPFGTGRSVSQYIEGQQDPYLLYHPGSYKVLRQWLEAVAANLDRPAEDLRERAAEIHPELTIFLGQLGFAEAWTRLQENARDVSQLALQFHRWFDAFRTLKLLHHLRDHGFPRQEMFGAIGKMLYAFEAPLALDKPEVLREHLNPQRRLLVHLRMLCREQAIQTGLL